MELGPIRKLTCLSTILIALLLLTKPSLGSMPPRISVENMTVGSIYYAGGSDFAVPYENTEWPAYLKLVEIRGVGGGCCYCGAPTGLYYIGSQWAPGPQFWIRTEYSVPLPANWPPDRCGCSSCFQTKFILHIFEAVSGLDSNTSDSDSDGVVDALDWSPNNPTLIVDPEYEKKELYLGSTSYQKNAPCPISDKRGNPISIFTGNKLEIDQDIQFNSPFKGDFLFTRYYNSQSDKTGPLGYGWSHSYHANLTVNYKSDPNLIKIKDESGGGSYFSTQDQVNFDGLYMEKTTVRFENNEYTWKRHDGKLFIFDVAGRLVRISDSVGNQQILSYDLNNRLDAVTDQASGRSLNFIYNTDGLLDHISGPVTPATPDGVWVSYGYSAGNLTSVTHAGGSGFVYQYADPYDAHNLTQKNDSAGSLLSTWSYDDQDRATANTTRDGKGVTVNYVSQSQVDVADAYGVTRSYTIDESIGDRKRIARVQGASGCSSCGDEPVRVEFDSSFRIIEKEYANGRVDRFEDFDSRDNAEAIRIGSGTSAERIIHFSYDQTNYPWLRLLLSRTETSVLDPGDGSRLRETIWDYDNDYNAVPNENPTPLLSRLIEKGHTRNTAGTVVPYESITVFHYNAKGQLVSIDGPFPGSSDTTSVSYDLATGDLLNVSRPLEGATAFADYTPSGRPQQMTDANGNRFSYTYDGRGRVRTVTSQADGSTSTIDYNAAGDPSRVTAANGVATDFEYDSTYGRLVRLLDPLGNYVSYGYDAQGNRIEQSIYNPSAQRVFWQRYDYQSPQTPGKLWKEINPDNSFTEYGYDSVGNLLAVIDPAGKTTTYGYDLLKRLTAATQPGAVQTLYGYDKNDNLTSVTDAEGRRTTYEHDDLGRQLKTGSPDTNVTTYAYDSAGNLVSKTDANGITTTYTYDALNRLSGIVYPDPAQNITYTYDEGANGKGRLTGMSDPSGVTAYAYDAEGNLIREIRTIGAVTYTTSYAYDAAGLLTGMTYPDGRSVAYVLDSAGRINRVTTTQDGTTRVLADSINYLPFGPVSGLTYGNGVNLIQNFDPLYRQTQVSAGSLYSAGFTRNATGNVTAIADSLDPTKNQTFGYDNLYRLTSATGVYGSIGYTYDRTGNRLTETVNGQSDTYSYAVGTSRLTQIAGANPQSFTMDPNGNTTAAGSKSFTYNQNNRLIQAAEGGTQLAAYTYNGSGQRVTKEAGGNAAVVYHYDRFGNLIAESSLSGEFLAAYVYLNGARLAAITPQGATELAVSVATSKGRNLSGVNVYAFTEAGAYTGVTAVTDAAGKAVFDPSAFGTGSYKFRADYLSSQFWSDVIALPGSAGVAILIAEETATLAVTQAGAPAAGVKVYLFSAGGTYLGLNQTTDANGRVSFDLPAGRQYKFRADVLGSQFFSEAVTIAAGGANSFLLATGGGDLTVTLGSGDGTPMQGVTLYLFSEQGVYLGLSAQTDSQGRASFAVPSGSYKVRADYLGHQFWTNVIAVGASLTESLTIPHQDVVITVNGSDDGDVVPRAGLKVYLFTPAGAYLEQNQTTDENGQARFRLPAQEYKVRADYLGQQFWSEVFVQADKTVTIPEGRAQVTVTLLNNPLIDVPVHVFSAAGAYLGLNAATAANGQAAFRLPAGEYNFRADYQSSQYFSGNTTLIADHVNPITVSTGGGNLILRVQEAPGIPMAGVTCYLFAGTGAYLGHQGATNDQGEAAFELADGSYQIRVDYLGYQFWTPVFATPATADLSFDIPHEDTVVTVRRDYNGDILPVENIPVHLFTAAGTYQGFYETADENGEAVFSLPDRDYKVRADFLAAPYWSEVFNQTDTTVTIPEGEVRITVTGGAAPLANVPVYVFTAAGGYLNITAATDAGGIVSFILPAGTYKFRADHQGAQFWATQAVSAHQLTPIAINTGGGPFVLRVEKAPGAPLSGVPVYVFSSSGSYLNLTKQTDAQGQASFELSEGSYKFRADYRGYQFWSTVAAVPGTLSGVLAIPHQDVTVTVSEVYQSSVAPLESIKVYLFTSGGAYQNVNATTSAQGQVTFNLPQKDYRVRADYLGGQYWSQVFNGQNVAIDIAHGYANVQVSEHGAAVYNAPVYLFTNTGTYLGRMLRTDAAGLARFQIPAAAYKFRVDYNSRQYWSDVVNLLANEETAVSLQLDLLALDSTNDPVPVRVDGTPPKLEQKPWVPQKRVLLASLFEINGILARAVVGQMASEGMIYYYINDHLGTPQRIIDESNNVVWSGDYRPFGSVNAAVAGLGNSFRFQGQFHDAETVLHYNYHRYYDPKTGRYMTPDPIGLMGGINPYVYVQNNPLNLVDPRGLKTLAEYWVPVEHLLSPFAIGGGSIISGAWVGTSGALLAVTSAAAIPETFGLSAIGIPVGVSLVAAGEYQVMFGTTTIINHLNNLIGAGLPSLSDYSRLFPAFPSGHNDYHESVTGDPCEN